VAAIVIGRLPTATQIAEYELILMLDPEAPDERRDEIATGVRQRIESNASLKHDQAWGMRKMAYEIRLRNEADYRFFRFEAESALLDDLDHNLKITDGVLRFRIFKVDPRAPVIEPPPPVALASSGSPGRGSGRRGAPDSRPPHDEAPAEQPVDSPPLDEPAEPAAPEPTEAPEAPDSPPAEAPAEPPAAPETPDSPPAEPEADTAADAPEGDEPAEPTAS
jgi:small subunit ribosomal protein S6